jgi:hypothetical protein
MLTLTGRTAPVHVRFAPLSIETGTAAPVPESARGAILTEASPDSPAQPRTPSHLQLSPDGRLVLREGKQEKADAFGVLKDTAIVSDGTTTEAKVRQRAVLLRQQSAAATHVARSSDWHAADARKSDIEAALFKGKLF